MCFDILCSISSWNISVTAYGELQVKYALFTFAVRKLRLTLGKVKLKTSDLWISALDVWSGQPLHPYESE